VIPASGHSVLTLSAAMSIFGVHGDVVRPPTRLLFPLLWGRHSSVSSPCVAKGRAQGLLRRECCPRLQRGCRTNVIRKGRKIKLGVVAACKWPGNLSATGNPRRCPSARAGERMSQAIKTYAFEPRPRPVDSGQLNCEHPFLFAQLHSSNDGTILIGSGGRGSCELCHLNSPRGLAINQGYSTPWPPQRRSPARLSPRLRC